MSETWASCGIGGTLDGRNDISHGRMVFRADVVHPGSAAVLEPADVVDLYGIAFLGGDFGEDPRSGRGNLGVDLVGRDLEQRLVALDLVADLLHPADDRAFGDRLPHLGHDHG